MKKPTQTCNSAGFDVTCRFTGHSPVGFSGLPMVFHLKIQLSFFGGRPPNPAALLVRQEDFFAQQWFSL